MRLKSANKECHIDCADSDLGQWTWSADGEGYFKARSGPYKDKLIHRVIAARMGLDLGLEIDHIDQCPSNNSRSNLRSATHSVNQLNGKTYSNSACGCRGVRYVPNLDKWMVRIQVNKVRKCLGYFASKEGASDCYLAYRAELLNNIKETDEHS